MVVGKLLGSAARIGGRAARGIRSSPALAGGAGVAGGALLDDIPVLNQLDFTEGSGGMNPLVVVGLLFGAIIALGTLFDINLGGN